MSQKKRIAFIGAGKQAQSAHIRNYAMLPDCEMAAIADLDEDLAKRVAARWGIPKVYANANDMVAKEKLDGLIMTLQPTVQGKILPELLKAKIPIAAEKPLAGTLEDGEKVEAAVRATGTWFRIAFHKRSDPATMQAKAEIERLKKTGELGALRYVRVKVSLSGDWIAGGYRDTLPPSKVMAGGNPPDPRAQKFTNFAATQGHQLDLMRHLLGESYRIEYAEPSEILVAIRSASGVPGVFEFTPYRRTKDWEEVALVAFERGFVRLTLPAPLAMNVPGKVEIYKDDPKGSSELVSSFLPSVNATFQQAQNFLSAWDGGAIEKNLCTVHEALESLQHTDDWLRRLEAFKK